GSKSDYFYNSVLINNTIVLVGSSFSTDGDMESFNLGNSDAIMFTIDNDLNVIDGFQLETLLMSSQKNLIANYGSSIPTTDVKDTLELYTTNDATSDLGNWCSSNTYFDPNGNYNFVDCLRPFDSGDIATLYYDAISTTNEINLNQKNTSSWLRFYFYMASVNSTFSPQLSNLTLMFEDDNYVTIEEAIELGYIEPLVLLGASHTGNYSFENSYNLINGGSTGAGNYPKLYLLIKTKNQKLQGIKFNSNDDYLLIKARLTIQELYNFDISLTPNNS
ncbi:MAG: hypothetical protein PHE54_03440, partial [Bacilli bacterium]|nr:hypothetical protein [Bacilli bacterium]